MSKMHVKFNELKSAFRGFKSHAPNANTDRYHCLDALYAVECGLKALILMEKSMSSTEELYDGLLTHNLHKLAEACDPPIIHELGASISLKCRCCPTVSISFEKFHQALRYGVKISDAEWKEHAIAIDSLYKKIKFRLNR